MNTQLAKVPVDITELLKNIDQSPDIPVVLPEQVKRFCGSISTGFEATAAHCDEIAGALEMAAVGLRERAKKLRAAAPDVRETIEEWITYERESHQRQKFYEPLFK